MKQIYLFNRLLASFVLLFMTTFSWAYDFEVDGIYYNKNSDGVSVSVTKTSSYGAYSGQVVIPSSVTYNDKNYSVSRIGSYAFAYCYDLTSVTIGDAINSIENEAFYGCSSLSSIHIPEGVKTIGAYAFCRCPSLTSITVDAKNSVYDSRNNCNALIEKSSNLLITGCRNSFIPNTVTSIGAEAFAYCSDLKSIFIPSSVTSMDKLAFADCSGLTSINIPESVTSIENSTFRNCSGLTSIVIPQSVTSIGGWAFSGCSGLTSITIPNSVINIGDRAFFECFSLSSLTIGSGVQTVGEYTFDSLNKLSQLTILCKNVGSYFKENTSLNELVLGNGVESIEDEAFYGCSGLTTISIGSGLKTIGTKAFANCGNINDVYCYATRYPLASIDAFENSYPDYITLHVPDDYVGNYKAVAPWSTFKNVVGISSGTGTRACKKPVLTYKDGNLEATSETEGAQCVIIISDEDVNTHFNSVSLTATYHISAYATKPNYKNSEIVTATLCWIDQEPETEGLINDVAEVRALPVLIQSEGGVISVNGINSGTEVRVYSVYGIMAGSAAATDNSAQINTNLLPGSIAIVKIGEKSVKIVMK